MKDWLAATLFFVGMSLFAAATMFAGYTAATFLKLSPDNERIAVGMFAVATLFITGIAFRAILRRIARR